MIQIDHHTITEEMFDRACRDYCMRLGKKKMEKQEYIAIANQLIDAYLFIGDAKRIGLTLSEDELQKTLDQVLASYPNRADFDAALEQLGDTFETFYEKLKSDLLLRKYLQQSFYDQVEIDESAVSKIYQANQDQFITSDQVKASHILVKELEKANQLFKELQEGSDFATLAKKHSLCPSGAKGGDLGFFKRGSMVKPFEEVAFSTKLGEISQPVETQFGFHLIQVTDQKSGGQMSFQEAQPMIEQQLAQQKLAEQMGKKVAELRSGVQISIDQKVLDQKGNQVVH